MAILQLSWLVMVILCPVVLTLVAWFVYFKLIASKYWARRNVPYLKPYFFFGNTLKANVKENFFLIIEKIHLENKSKKAIGYWSYTKPQLLVMDSDLAKRILIKDFHIFKDRGFEVFGNLDPVSANLFMIGGKKWRNLRVKMTPTFTSGKMKVMWSTMIECGEKLQKYLTALSEASEPVEVKDLMSRFLLDVIASCAFGIESNSLQNLNSEFQKFGHKIFNVDIGAAVRAILTIFYPKLGKLLRVRFIPKEVSDFFINVVTNTIEYREKNNITRNDFLQLMIQLMRAGKIEDVDKNPVDVENLDDDALVEKFSLLDATAQCVAFLGAGYETSSSALTFALYELALHPDIQTKLQESIDQKIKEYGLSYEAMMNMDYLDWVVQETLRKYPPVGHLQRINNEDYYIPELKATIEKGTMVVFSTRGFHYDSETYPDPHRFDPERFSPEQKAERGKGDFLSFGEGPRNCIGNRFGLMQIKVALISMMRAFNVEMSKETPTTVKYNARTFSPVPIGGMPLNFTKRH